MQILQNFLQTVLLEANLMQMPRYCKRRLLKNRITLTISILRSTLSLQHKLKRNQHNSQILLKIRLRSLVMNLQRREISKD